MRAKRTIDVPTAVKLAVGASVLAFPATALAVTTDGTSAQASTGSPVPAVHGAHKLSVDYGQKTIIRGTAPVYAAVAEIELEYRASNARRWETVAAGRVHPGGRFRLSARLGRSGALKIVPTSGQAADTAFGAAKPGTATTTTLNTTLAGTGSAVLAASAVTKLTVKPELALSRRMGTAVVGQSTRISGRLLPGIPGRRVVLEARQGRRWVPVASGRTHSGGRFDVRFAPGSTGTEVVHVAFGGDRLNARADSATESIAPMEYAQVSWYDDAGDTACGFHATYGIASRTLPCGTKVTLSYGGRTVVATVDDRGPFVYSRLYDLDQNTAGALGMDGVATVLASA